MSDNRLFIYDPESNSAVCIAKGYACGWATPVEYVDNWFDANREYNVPTHTRYRLVTEYDMPKGASIVYEPTNRSEKRSERGDAGTRDE